MKNLSLLIRTVWCLALLLPFAGTISAQSASLTGKKLNTKHTELDKSFAVYEIFEIDISTVQALTRSGTAFEFSLQLDQHNWDVYLEHNDLRGPNYREVAITDRGNKVLPPRPNVTFKGYAGTGDARFTINDKYLIARLVQGDKIYYLEPLSRLIDNLPKNQYVYYEVEDILADPSVECVHHAGKRYAPPLPNDPTGTVDPLRMMECLEVEMATAGDFTMFNRYSSVMDVNDFILNVTNLMEPLYAPFNLDFVIVDQFVSTAQATDPFDAAGDEAFDILDAFRPWAGANFSNHDLGQLWTAKNIRGCNNDDDDDDSTNFGLIGCADAIGDVCGSNRYNLCEDWSNSSNCLRNISAHEIGHVFDGVHSLGPDAAVDIMGPNIACSETAFSAANITRMQAHIDGIGCLANCGPCATDMDAPAITCGTFSMVFDRCPAPLGPNTPVDDSWFPVGADGRFNSAAGGSSIITVDLNGCVTDATSSFANIEFTLFDSYEIGTCPVSIFNEFILRDECGNVSTDVITVEHIFSEDDAPMITAPAMDMTVQCDGGGNMAQLNAWLNSQGGAAAEDNCFNTVTWTNNFTSLSNGCGATGAATVTFTARDACGNPATTSATFTIEDTTAPEFSLTPGELDIDVDVDPNICVAAGGPIGCSFSNAIDGPLMTTVTLDGQEVGTYPGPMLSDVTEACGEVVITCGFQNVFNTGCTVGFEVFWIATDECGNASDPYLQAFTINEVTAPEFDPACAVNLMFNTEDDGLCPADADISLSEGDVISIADTWTIGGLAVPSLAGCVSDNCTAEGEIIITVDDITITDDGTCSRVIEVTFTADDGCGNISDPFTLTYTIIDDTAPVFDLICQIDAVFTTENGNVCPADATISLNEGDVIDVFTGWTVGGVPILPLEGCVADNCTADADLNITVDDITVVDDGTCSRVITVTFIADDGCGNFSDPFVCNYTFLDDTGPEVSFNGIPNGGTYVIECDLPSETWDPLVDIGELTITDNCSAIDFAGITEVLTQLYDGPCVGNLLTRWQQVFTVQDVCGNTTVYTLFTEIIDTTPPAFTSSPDDVTIECDQTAPVPDLEAFDSCSEVIYNFTEVRTDGDCPNNYTLTRTWTATDGCGNSSDEVQIVTVEDTTPPVIEFIDGYINTYTPGQDVFVECSELGNISQLIANNAIASDNCSGNTPVSYTLENLGGFDCQEFGYSGALISTWTSTDECGNTATATINWFLVDETPPVFQGLPEDACAELGDLPPVANVQAVDDCELPVLTFNQSDPIECDGGQYIERTWTAEDVCGNSSSYTQRITINSDNGPSITIDYPEIGDVMDGDLVQIPIDCTQALEFSEAALKDAITINSGCGAGESSIELALMDEGSCTENGYLARYRLGITASDACGNTASFDLTIDFVDQTLPIIDGPSEVRVDCGEEMPTPIATDACGEVVSMTFVDSAPIEVSCPDNPVAYERTWTATDECGNSATFTQLIAVLDNEGPIFSGVPADACNNTGIDVEVQALDECTGEQAMVSFDEITTSETGCGEVLTRTWTATDACGNTSTATQQVFFTDDEAPSIEFTSDLLAGVQNGGGVFLSVGDGLGDPNDPLLFTAEDVTVTDNCATLTAEVDITTTLSEDCAADGYLTRYDYLFTATDPCGNTSAAKLSVYYVDNNAPDLFNVPADVDVFCSAVPAVADVIASDDYTDEVDVLFSETQTMTPEGMLITRTWTATDECGNTNSASQQILVVNNDLSASFSLGSEVIECNSDNNRLGVTVMGGTPPYTYQWELTDPLEDGYITTDPTRPAILFTMGYITQTFSVLITDDNGCELLASITIVCDFEDDEGDFFVSGNSTPATAALLVYPNPVNEQLVVNAPQLVDTPVTVGLYNLFGQEVLRQEVDAWTVEGLRIDTRQFPSGIYVLRFQADGQEVQAREIVIVH